MRVLHIDTGMGWRGGQQQVLWLLQELRQRGLEQSLLSPAESPLGERVRREGLAVAALAHPALSLGNILYLRRQARARDLIHAHDSHAHTLAWLALAGTRKRRPRLVVSRRVGFPIQGVWSRPKYAVADAYIAVSEFVRQQLLDAQVPAEKIRVVYDGIHLLPNPPDPAQRAELRRRYGVGDPDFLLGTLTSMAPEKRLEEKLELLTALPPWVHLWLGRPAAENRYGAAETALLVAARRCALEQRFRIFALDDDPEPFLGSLDLFLYLSRSEGLGSAILLAMAHGLPVIASRVGGIPEIVRDRETGLLVNPDSPQNLPRAVAELLDSPDLRQQLAAAGRTFVETNATSAIMAAQTAAFYDELWQGSGQHGR